MLTSGDVVELDLGAPRGHEAGYLHPAIVVTAQRVLDGRPSVVQVVPLTSTLRGFASEVELVPEAANGLDRPSAAQCQHVRAVSTDCTESVRGNIGAAALGRIRSTLGLILDIDG